MQWVKALANHHRLGRIVLHLWKLSPTAQLLSALLRAPNCRCQCQLRKGGPHHSERCFLCWHTTSSLPCQPTSSALNVRLCWATVGCHSVDGSELEVAVHRRRALGYENFFCTRVFRHTNCVSGQSRTRTVSTLRVYWRTVISQGRVSLEQRLGIALQHYRLQFSWYSLSLSLSSSAVSQIQLGLTHWYILNHTHSSWLPRLSSQWLGSLLNHLAEHCVVYWANWIPQYKNQKMLSSINRLLQLIERD